MSEEKKREKWTCLGGICIKGDVEESTERYDELLEEGVVV